MKVHLVDGTYELFRYHFALPSHITADGPRGGGDPGRAGHGAAAARGGRHPRRRGHRPRHRVVPQRPLAGLQDERGHAARAAGPVPAARGGPGRARRRPCSPMVEYEADDAMAAAAAIAADDPEVEQVLICTPDKDLGQCVRGDRVVQLDRRKGVVFDDAGVREKFGVAPESIPDYLGLVGDSADGFPGLPGWGAKSAAAVLARYGHLEEIPRRRRRLGRRRAGRRPSWPSRCATSSTWPCCSGASPRSRSTRRRSRRSASSSGAARGPSWSTCCEELEAPGLVTRAVKLAERRG